MGLLDFFRPKPLGIGLPATAPRVADASTSTAAIPTVYGTGGAGLSWNLQTGQGTDRDPLEAEVLRYVFLMPEQAQYETLLRRSGVAQRLCEMRPKWCTRKGAASFKLSDLSPSASPLSARMTSLKVAEKCREGAIEANKYGNSATWIQVEERGAYRQEAQGAPLQMAAVTGIHDLLTLAKKELRPILWQDRTGDPWIPLGSPLIYEVQLTGTSARFQVHASRLILWRGAPVPRGAFVPPSFGWGDDSILLASLTALQSMGYIRRAFDRASNAYQKLVAYCNLPPVGTPLELRKKHADAWTFLSQQSALGVFLAEKGNGQIPSDKIETLDAPLTGLIGLGAEGEKFLARESGIPPQVWSGEYTGGLGDMSGQLHAFLLDIEAEQADRFAPAIRYIAEILYAAAGVYRPVFDVVFAPLAPSDPLKEAQARKTQLEGDQILSDLGAIHPMQIFRSRVATGYRADLEPALSSEIPSGRPAAPIPGAPAGAARAPAADATDGLWIGLAVDVGGLPRAARAMAPGLRLEPWPHVTLLYLGAVQPGAMAAVLGAAAEAAQRVPVEVVAVEVGPLGDDGAQVVFLRRRNLEGVQNRLLRACAHMLTAEQFPAFIPHVTLGYGDGDISGLPLPDTIKVLALCVRRGDVEIARYAVER